MVRSSVRYHEVRRRPTCRMTAGAARALGAPREWQQRQVLVRATGWQERQQQRHRVSRQGQARAGMGVRQTIMGNKRSRQGGACGAARRAPRLP
jgi:hypothetical protein